MNTSATRVISIAAIVAIGLSCSDNSLVPRGGLAAVHLLPSFAQGPNGGPDIHVARLTGVLRHGVDSVLAEAVISGDSAIIEFQRVPVSGDSTRYALALEAFDSAGVLVFTAQQELQVLSGGNPPVSAVLQYSAPDTAVATIDVAPDTMTLDYAGASTSENSCLFKQPSTTARTSAPLAATGKTAAGQAVASVRVGWTSRDTTVATVDDHGVVRSRCSSKTTWIIARTFLNKVDSARVTVTAPAFALRMSPESTVVARGSKDTLTALSVDETGNTTPVAATSVTWNSSDPTRATVVKLADGRGLVTGVANGRVLITALSGNRTSLGVVQVVRPKASTVEVLPKADTALVGEFHTFFARAYDAQGRVIGDATQFEWYSTDTTIARVSSGTARALKTGTATIRAAIDGKQGGAPLSVVLSMPTGAVEGVIKDGATDLGISGATVQRDSSSLARTDGFGNFTLGGLHNGDNVTVSATGYTPVTVYNVPVYSNDTLRIPSAPLAPVSGSTGTMTGRVVNALNGQAAANVTVKAYAGVNAAPSAQRPDVLPDYATTTGSDGSYTITGAKAGAYTFVASGTGYSETNSVGIALGGTTKSNSDIILPPTSAGGGMYAVLTWSSCGGPGVPCDLDFHLTGPRVDTATARFHVYKDSVAYVAGDTIAALDVSDASGPGPEVLSIRPSANPGRFRFSVYDASNALNSQSLALSQTSGARVDVYMNNRVVATFFPPSNSPGNVWAVFEWDGARITQVGSISYQASQGSVP